MRQKIVGNKFNSSIDASTTTTTDKTLITTKSELTKPKDTAKTESVLLTKKAQSSTAVDSKAKKEEAPAVKTQKTKKRRRFKAKKLVLNVSQTKYNVVRYAARTVFKMRLSGAPYMPDYSNPNDEWDIFWTDGSVQVDKLYRMKPY